LSRNPRTLAAYEAAADLYAEQTLATPSAPLLAFIDSLVEMVPAAATVLEIGSATGRDAALFEARGMRVCRTDATQAFVSRMRAHDQAARLLNILTDDLGGPWDLIYASAVFLHFSVAELTQVLAKAAGAVLPGGLLAFTVKQGSGAAWSTAKLGRPRHFTYWREPALRALIDASAWQAVSIEQVAGANEDWLYSICRRPAS